MYKFTAFIVYNARNIAVTTTLGFNVLVNLVQGID